MLHLLTDGFFDVLNLGWDMEQHTRWIKKKYRHLMSHKKETIALISEIWFGFDSKSLKLDHDMKTITLGLYQLDY